MCARSADSGNATNSTTVAFTVYVSGLQVNTTYQSVVISTAASGAMQIFRPVTYVTMPGMLIALRPSQPTCVIRPQSSASDLKVRRVPLPCCFFLIISGSRGLCVPAADGVLLRAAVLGPGVQRLDAAQPGRLGQPAVPAVCARARAVQLRQHLVLVRAQLHRLPVRLHLLGMLPAPPLAVHSARAARPAPGPALVLKR